MGIGVIETRQQMAVVSSGAIKIPIIATEDLPAFSVITDTGKVADSTNPFYKNIIIGIVPETILDRFSGKVIIMGQIINPLWAWTRGDILYLNGTTISKTPPTTGFRVMIGQALSATEVDVKITESILL